MALKEFFKKLAENKSTEEAFVAFKNSCLKRKLALEEEGNEEKLRKELNQILKLYRINQLLTKISK